MKLAVNVVRSEKKATLNICGFFLLQVSSVVQKVALQINCKLGGELWGCDIPMKHLMVVGVDVYHDITRRMPSIAGIVSSTNAAMSRWYSSTVVQASGQELIDLLKPAFVKAIKEYYKANHAWPENPLSEVRGGGRATTSNTTSVRSVTRRRCLPVCLC